MANFSIDNHETALVSDAIESARAQSLNRKININNHKKHKRTKNDYLQNGFFFISKGKNLRFNVCLEKNLREFNSTQNIF